jgi:lysophospholipid acyltransferase
VRLLYGLILGFAIGFLQFGKGLYSFLFSSFVVYLLMAILPRRSSAIPIFVFSLGYLSYIHIYRILYEYGSWNMDVSLVMMMATCKYVSIGWAY